MLCVGLLLSSDEWQRIQQAAAEQFPGKVFVAGRDCAALHACGD
jgi:hypothetical protein